MTNHRNQEVTAISPDFIYYRQLFEYAPEPLWLTDLDGKIQAANPAALKLVDRSRGSLLGQPLTNLLPQKDRSDFRARLVKLSGSDSPQEWEQPLLRAHGAVFPARLRVNLIRDANDRPRGLCWSMHETGGEKGAETAAPSQPFSASKVRQLHTTLNLAELTARVVRLAIPGFADLCVLHLRNEQEQLVGIQVAHRDPEQEQELARLENQYRHALARAQSVEDSNSNGQRMLVPRVANELQKDIAYADAHLRALSVLNLKSYISVPLRAHGQALGAIMFATVDSGRIYAPRDLEQAEDLARHAAIAIENARAYAAAQADSREWQTALAFSWQETHMPLQVIARSLHVLKNQAWRVEDHGGEEGDSERVVLEPGAWREHLQHIEQAADRLRDLSNRIADLVQLQNGSAQARPVWLNLSQIVSGVTDELRAQIEAGRYARAVRLELDLPTAAPVWAKADRGQIERVVRNVVDNALKYSPPGGQVRVQLALEEDPEQGPEPHAHLAVIDEGIGIPPAEQARIFKPFFRGSNTVGKNFSGLGVGLTISRELIHQHGGNIWIESEGVGKGTTVHILLPQAELGAE